MQILDNNMLSRERLILFTNSYLNKGWVQKNYNNKFDSGMYLEREESVGIVSKRVERIQISFLDISGEIVIHNQETNYVGADSVLNTIKYFMSNGENINEAIASSKRAHFINDIDIKNFQTCYDTSGLVIN